MKMLEQIDSFGRKARVEQAPEHAPLINQYPVAVEMPTGSEDQMVSSNSVLNSVMMALLWQQYSHDQLHPESSRWLELNAPGGKSAVGLNDRGLPVRVSGKLWTRMRTKSHRPHPDNVSLTKASLSANK